jgi:hypothetical protein
MAATRSGRANAPICNVRFTGWDTDTALAMPVPAMLAGLGGTVRPTLVINPVTDRTFSAFAQEELERSLDAAALQLRLRTRYPHAVVHPRVLSGELIPIWYVYRDGRWTDPGTI